MNTAKLNRIFKSFLFLASFGLILNLSTPLAHAQGPQVWERRGLNCTGSEAFRNVDGTITTDARDVATIQGLSCLIANVLSVAITLIGLAAFVMFIFASFKLLVKAGDSKSKEEAKNTFTYAVIGIVVALSAFIILNLIGQFTGVDVTSFIIPEAGVNL